MMNALIIDIENSRKYTVSDRNNMQSFIMECIEWLNEVFGRVLEFKVVSIALACLERLTACAVYPNGRKSG